MVSNTVLMLAVSVVIAVFALIASMASTVLERRREIGVLKALGLRRKQLYRLFLGEEQVGEVTSGAPSPTLGFGIGLAYVEVDYAEPGTALELEVRGGRLPVEVVKKPFYKRAV